MADQVDTGLSKGVGMGVIVRSTMTKASIADASAVVDPSSSSSSSSSKVNKVLFREVEGVTPRCQEVSRYNLPSHISNHGC